MGNLFTAIKNLLAGVGLSGFVLDIAGGAVLSLLAMAVIPAMGWLIERGRHYLYLWLCNVFHSRAGYIVMNYATFPGVMLHELCHVLMAKLTGAKVDKVKFFEPSGTSLGYVQFHCNGKKSSHAFQMAATACAPVALGFVVVALLRSGITFFHGFPVCQAYLWHMLVSMLLHMTMSKEDLKSYLRGCAGLFWRFLIIGFLVMFFTGRVVTGV